jgi:hypothetical protein
MPCKIDPSHSLIVQVLKKKHKSQYPFTHVCISDEIKDIHLYTAFIAGYVVDKYIPVWVVPCTPKIHRKRSTVASLAASHITPWSCTKYNMWVNMQVCWSQRLIVVLPRNTHPLVTTGTFGVPARRNWNMNIPRPLVVLEVLIVGKKGRNWNLVWEKKVIRIITQGNLPWCLSRRLKLPLLFFF